MVSLVSTFYSKPRSTMASSSNIFFVSLLLSISSLSLLINGDSSLIQQTCKNTKHYNLCVSSLKSDPTSAKSDTKGLATIMVSVGIANSTATASYLSSQILNSGTGNDTLLTKKVLLECANKYSNASDALHASLQDLADEVYDYASLHVMAAADYPNACHNAFRRYPGMVYPPGLARREVGLKHICDVVMSMINLLG